MIVLEMWLLNLNLLVILASKLVTRFDLLQVITLQAFQNASPDTQTLLHKPR